MGRSVYRFSFAYADCELIVQNIGKTFFLVVYFLYNVLKRAPTKDWSDVGLKHNAVKGFGELYFMI
jgi:hypothetical protein